MFVEGGERLKPASPLILLDFEDLVSLLIESGIIDLLHLRPNALNQILRQPLLPLCEDINSSGRKQRLLEEDHSPPAFLLAMAEDLPVTGRDL